MRVHICCTKPVDEVNPAHAESCKKYNDYITLNDTHHRPLALLTLHVTFIDFVMPTWFFYAVRERVALYSLTDQCKFMLLQVLHMSMLAICVLYCMLSRCLHCIWQHEKLLRR